MPEVLRILSRLTPRPVKHGVKLWLRPEYRDPRYRELERLRNLTRYQADTTTLMGEPIRILDAGAFLTMHKEIVEEAIYHFRTQNKRPYIIDGGANIGVSVLYFKQVYPGAHIVAFEPDDAAFSLLKVNVGSRGYDGVTLVNKALAATDTSLSFAAEGAYAGRLARAGDSSTASVPAVRLRPYLDRRVDLLKLNIEGAETEVLEDCADLLGNVERIVLEYHSFAREGQSLHTLLSVLADVGYRLYVRSVHSAWPLQPFIDIPVHLGMDLQLYVYAYRDWQGREKP
ncbi:MAG TPA: FkbM family methyltransferase [Blastocatellia bacterium]|nr:FkbM family methyltransferase [Blastocatellia bacterium]